MFHALSVHLLVVVGLGGGGEFKLVNRELASRKFTINCKKVWLVNQETNIDRKLPEMAIFRGKRSVNQSLQDRLARFLVISSFYVSVFQTFPCLVVK